MGVSGKIWLFPVRVVMGARGFVNGSNPSERMNPSEGRLRPL